MTIEYDIIIVGGGPAGSSAAFFSKYYDKENMKKVLLLEKFSDDKYALYHDMCGCCISKDAFQELKPIVPSDIIETIQYIKEYAADELIKKYKMNGFIINRPLFQKRLLNQFKEVGGEVKTEKVIDIEEKDNLVSLKTNEGLYKSKYVIAADGANSTVRKILGLRKIQTIPAFQFVIDKEPEHDIMQLYYDEQYQGDYKWIFPNGASTRIGFPFIKGLNYDVNGKILQKQCRVIGFGGCDDVVHNRVLFVGDAAGQTNILSKGGLRPGMVAGKKVAESLIRDNNPLKYRDWWNDSWYNSELMTKVFTRLSQLNNRELIEHMEPFRDNILSAWLKIILLGDIINIQIFTRGIGLSIRLDGETRCHLNAIS